MKKFIAITLALVMLLSMAAVCHAETYWDVQADYIKAIEKNDLDAIISCVKRLEKVYSSPSTESEYARLATPFEKAALAYLKKNMFAEACEYYKKSYQCYDWLDKHGTPYFDKLKCLDAMITHTGGAFEIYAEVADPVEYPYYGAKNEPEKGTYFGSSDISTHPGECSAQLIYVQYLTEQISKYQQRFPEEESVIEIAWNVKNETYEDLIDVVDPKNFEYLKNNVDFLASQNQKILLRFGAEVNCWQDLNNYWEPDKFEKFTEAFKKAFRYIADYVHENAPNVAMVYSPNDISGWYCDPTDFYPGDEYVDWVGMSSYNNISTAANGSIESQTDAAYSRGFYENQIMRIKDIVEEYGSRKPIMISECGFCYSSNKSTQTVEHAVSSLSYFYTYVNRVYPQVKAVFYFNTNFGGNNYKLKENEDVLDAYTRTVGLNVSMQATIGGSDKYYTEFSKVNEITDGLKISAFAYYPGCELSVSYAFDGAEPYVCNSYPYDYTISNLSEGVHKLTATLTAGKTTVTKNYGLYVDEDGRVSTLISAMKDVGHSFWGYDNIAYCLHNGIFAGTAPDTFAPNAPMTRAMLVTVLYRLDNKPSVEGLENVFFDVKDGTWYTDAVKWAYSKNIVAGTSKTTFSPDTNITREQTAAMLYRYAAYKGYDVENTNDISDRIDYSNISAYAVKNMSWANYHRIILGDNRGYLLPKGNATRAEVATMLRAFNNLEK